MQGFNIIGFSIALSWLSEAIVRVLCNYTGQGDILVSILCMCKMIIRTYTLYLRKPRGAIRSNPPQSGTIADTVADVVAEAFADTVADVVADVVTDAFADTVADVFADAVADTMADSVAPK